MMYSKIAKFLFLLSIFFLNTNCSKDEQHPIPNVSFSVEVPSTLLVQMGVNTSMFYTGSDPAGIKGVIIFKKGDNEYEAYERLCPYYPNETCALDINNGITATCPCCKSEFSLVFGGSVMEGVAKYPMKVYQTSLVNGRLFIMN